jgi:hypothetical protein
MATDREQIIQIVSNLDAEKLGLLSKYLHLLLQNQISSSGIMPISIRDKMRAAGYNDLKDLFAKIETQNLKTSVRGNYFYSPLFNWLKFELSLMDHEAKELTLLLGTTGYVNTLIW